MILVIETDRLVCYYGLSTYALSFWAITEVMPGVGFLASGVHTASFRGLLFPGVGVECEVEEVRLLWL